MNNILLKLSFGFLFFLTPLVFTPLNSELFEFNKMILVYVLTVIITATWLIKMLQARQLLIAKTPLDLPILLFLLANIFSTIFSTDVHTSIWGYYSRSNGGLISTISYVLLYYALVSNFQANQLMFFLKTMLWGGLLVSLWAIPEHFGASPSCLLLTGSFTDSCWVQDVQARVFATLGQPNWLAAYLAMLIFPGLYCFLTAKTTRYQIIYFVMVLAYYLAFTFTYSRGATFGLLAGLAVFGGLLAYKHRPAIKTMARPIGIVVAAFVLINLLFGSSLSSFKLINKFSPPPRPSVSLPQAAPSGTQLENGGTESGQIRFIVWKGALEVYKHYPIFGSGLETFGYIYYTYRPVEHNLVSEWEFLYNKAHNEFLNYLATTGTVGFASYLFLIGWFLWTTVQRIFKLKEAKTAIFLAAMIGAYISYLVQNIFGFSVVIIALFFYLFPALSWLSTSEEPQFYSLFKTFKVNRGVQKVAIILICLVAFWSVWTVFNVWRADVAYSQGSHYNDAGNPSRSYQYLLQAVNLNPREPLYYSELGYSEAGNATLQADQDATLSAQLKALAVQDTRRALQISPTNLSIVRTAIRSYFLLATIDSSFIAQTLSMLDTAMKLAPTDPKLPYNKAIVLQQLSEASTSAQLSKQAIGQLQKAIELKPNYREAHLALAELYAATDQKDLAIEELNLVLKLIPHDPEAEEKLKSLE